MMEKHLYMTVAQLREQINKAPDNAQILCETRNGMQFEVERAMVIGTNTDDPGLIIKLVRTR